jgi:methylmalonyl-CoA/ethylmalonyl-CoA epimerase
MYTINHVGLAVPNVADYLAKMEPLYAGYSRSRVIENHVQHVREVFLSDGRTTIELLEPMGETSPLDGFLRKNPMGGLVHLCFDCDNVTDAIKELMSAGARLINEPTPDEAFDGRPIAFLFMAGQLLELVQR